MTTFCQSKSPVNRCRTTWRLPRLLKSLREPTTAGGGKIAYLSSDENWEAFVRNLASTSGWLHPAGPRDQSGQRSGQYLTLPDRRTDSDHHPAADDRHVTFLARQGVKTGGGVSKFRSH
ncbi:MAG: hypothetical protein R3C05_01900 [Pirellulaceae bacterium]